MHAAWTNFSEEAKIIFLHEQQVFSKENFSPSKIRLSFVELSFFPGYQLVRAEIEPQTVELEGGGRKEVTELRRSFFLYNRTTDDLVRKVVPLEPNSSSIFSVNTLLKVRITADTAVDYAKYFGLIAESPDHRESFFFIDDIREIPWSESANSQGRERVIGMLQALSPLKADGHFDVGLREEKSLWLGSVYRMTMPCIFQKSAFTVRLSVSPSGFVRMDEDFPLPENTFKDLSVTLPYYRIEPTGKLSELIKRRTYRNRIISAGVGIITLSLVAFAFVGLAFVVIGVTDVLLGAFDRNWATNVDTFFRGHERLLKLSMVGCVVSLFFSVVTAGLGWAAETVGRQRPGLLAQFNDRWRTQLRKRHTTWFSRVRALILRILFGVAILFTTWGCIFYAVNVVGPRLFLSPAEVDLRSSIGFAFEQAIGWFLRHPASSFPAPLAPFIASFSHIDQLSTFGKGLKFLMLSSIPLLLFADIERFWRFTKRNSQ
jgi:hypothetical protein